jgi:hypothetical protein
MDNYDNIKIVIGDIIHGQAGICITFIVLCNNQDENKFIGYIKYIDIKNKEYLNVIDMAWDIVVNNVNEWLESLSICKQISNLKNTNYNPKIKITSND